MQAFKLVLQGGAHTIGHVSNIPKMQIFTGISRNTQLKPYMLSLTECVWEFLKQCIVGYLLTSLIVMEGRYSTYNLYGVF